MSMYYSKSINRENVEALYNVESFKLTNAGKVK